METAYDSSSAAMENCTSDDDGAGGDKARPRIVAQQLVNCGDDDGAGGEARPRVAHDDGEGKLVVRRR